MTKKRRVRRMAQAQPARVAPVEVAALPEDALVAAVVQLVVEAEGVQPDSLVPVGAEPGQRARLLADVALGVAAARRRA